MEVVEEEQASIRPGVKRGAPDDDIAPVPKRQASVSLMNPSPRILISRLASRGEISLMHDA